MKTVFSFIFFLINVQVFCQDNSSQVYSVVQEMPVYPGGEDSMWRFISTNVIYPDSAIAHNVEGKLIMGFVVNQDGSISDVVIRRGLTTDIDSEGMRVVRLLPRFSPGRQDGKAVRVSYTLPIAFKLKSNPADTIKKPKVIEHMPEFPGGEAAMMRMIQKNINYPIVARDNGIQGRVVLGFVVTEDGSIDSIKIRKSVCPSIDAEAIRVVKLLPKFKPGDQQGKPVRVSFVLPIMFALANEDKRMPQEPPPFAWDGVPEKADILPEFPGGITKLIQFLNTNVKYPGDAKNLFIQGVVTVGFIVNEDGHLSDFGFVRKDYLSLNKEAMRVAKSLPPFKPGMKNGKPVKVLFKLPINFKMDAPQIEKKYEPINIDVR